MVATTRLAVFAGFIATLCVAGCATSMTSHPTQPSALGRAPSTTLAAALSGPGIVRFERIAFADWPAARGSFLDLTDARAQAAGARAATEPAVVYAYVLDHPTRGRWLIDTGASERLPSVVGPLMRAGLRGLNITVRRSTASVAAGGPPVQGVLLTHLHFDHIGGLLDLPLGTPVYVGPGEADPRSRINTLLGRPTDAILRGRPALNVWRFQADPDNAFVGIVDVFGDGSVVALQTPGHSPGSTAYLVMSTDGPKLVTGDAVHTRLGWERSIPQVATPGFSRSASDDSADRLRAFAAAHPQVEVFLGHQSLPGQTER